MKIEYVDQKIIPAYDGGIDHGADQLIVAQFPRVETQVIWQKGCKRWKNRLEGSQYYTGNFAYQTIGYRCTERSGFSHDLTEGCWSGYGGLDADENRPKLNAKWVRLMLVKCANIRDNPLTGFRGIPYSVVEAQPQYKRGKTMIINWEDELDELHEAMVNLGVL